MSSEITVGQALIRLLEVYDVDTVFGIPGVHTAELYRGLAGSSIRHVTPRDEQDAGFMADGYARVSGKPGFCLLITGPGLTNAITPMAQARADSIPMLAISGVNARHTLGQYKGHLHELPDQAATMRTIALSSERLEQPGDLAELVGRAFARMKSGRPGPVHIEIPTDLMEAPFEGNLRKSPATATATAVDSNVGKIKAAATLCAEARRPLILAGGGANRTGDAVSTLSQMLDAPVVTTTNARGLLGRHPLVVPASPSLPPIRQLIVDADLVIAIGTQFGPTDYDMYVDGGFEPPARMIRIDVDPDAEATSAPAGLMIVGDAAPITAELISALQLLPQAPREDGKERATVAKAAAYDFLSPKMQALTGVLDTIRDALPGSSRGFHTARLCWQPFLRSRWRTKLVQCFDRVRRARIWSSGRRGGQSCAGRHTGGLSGGRRRFPVLSWHPRYCRRRKSACDFRRLEQSRLSGNRRLHAFSGYRARGRSPHTSRFSQARAGLWHTRGTYPPD